MTAIVQLRFTEQVLDGVTAEILKPMSRRWGGKGNEAKAVCIRRIVEGLADPEAVRQALTGLSPETRAALALLKEHGGVVRVGILEDLLQVYGYQVRQQPSVGYGYGREHSTFVARLITDGFLLLAPRYAVFSPYGQYRYAGMPLEETVFIDERFLAQIDWPLEVRPLAMAPTAFPPPTSTFRRPHQVTLDLLAVARTFTDLAPLKLTKAQTVRAADLKKLQKSLGWPETPSFDAFPFPAMTPAVLHAWFASGLLRIEDNTLMPAMTPEALARLPLPLLVSRLITGFIGNLTWCEQPDVPEYRWDALPAARAALVHSLRALPPGTDTVTASAWVAGLYDRVQHLLATNPDYQDRPPVRQLWKSDEEYRTALTAWEAQRRPSWIARERPFAEAALTTWLYWLGIVELGRMPDQTLAFRLTDLGRNLFIPQATEPAGTEDPSATAWVVQPNHDIVVYLDAVTSAQLAFLEQHAERRQADTHLAHYQLTRDAVYRGLQGGTTLEVLLETLRGGARADLPQNVEREMRAWAEHREQITLTTQARLIAFPSPETRKLALEAGLPGTPVGETYVRVAPEAQINAALKAVFGLQRIPTIDYAQPPAACLEADEDGTLTLLDDPGDLLLRQQLARCALPVDATHWRITKETLAAQRRAGVTPAMAVGMLQARVRGVIPPVLEIAITNALGTRDTIQCETVLLLRVTNKKLYTALTTSPMIAPLLRDVPGPDTIAVSQAQLDAFTAQLEWLGVKRTDLGTVERPDWQKTIRDAKSTQRRRMRY